MNQSKQLNELYIFIRGTVLRPEYSHLLHQLISRGTAKFKVRIIFVKNKLSEICICVSFAIVDGELFTPLKL